MIPGFFAAAGRYSPPVPIEQAPFYSGDLITRTGWETVTWPGAFYDDTSNRTIVAWQFVGVSGNKGVHVAAYDHAAGTWTRPYSAGTFTLPNDDHGHPALVRDAEGYIHCFFGSHSTNQQWSVTTSPDDITSWSAMPAIAGGYTYPKPVSVGGEVLLFLRDINQFLGLVVRRLTPSGGAGTWGASTTLVTFGLNTRVYTTEPHLVGSTVHFLCMFTERTDISRRGVYYFIYDPATGDLSNFDGSVTVPPASQPVGLSQADADFRIFDHGSNAGDVPSLQFDDAGRPHVLVADGAGPTYDLKHMMLEGGAWTAPVAIGSIVDQQPAVGYVDSYYLAPGPSGTMEAWYNVGGDRVRRVRSSSGAWSPEAVIAEADDSQFGGGSAVGNSHPAIRTVFAPVTATPDDSSAEALDLYAHGDGGFLPASIPASADPHWGDVTLLVEPDITGTAKARDVSKSCLPVSFVGAASVESDAPFAGGRSIRTGNGNYFTVPQHVVISTGGTDDFTLDVWFKLDEAPNGRIQAIAASRTSGFALIVNDVGTLQFLTWDGGTLRVNLIGADSVVAGRWYLASAERDGADCSLYLDGVLQASAPQSAPPAIGNAPVNFGRDPQVSGRHLDGWICEPRFTRVARYRGGFTPALAPFPR